uniref:Uncharacterized protein n=1 Tax=Timema monikensis TaxID=170555 RepID=A0A7R9E0Q6_9NEOP|nr:unnamed protein product [Timema monikensis]
MATDLCGSIRKEIVGVSSARADALLQELYENRRAAADIAAGEAGDLPVEVTICRPLGGNCISSSSRPVTNDRDGKWRCQNEGYLADNVVSGTDSPEQL